MFSTLVTQLIRFASVGAPCDPSGGDFFGLPPWYKYLGGQIDNVTGKCAPIFNFPSDTWLIIMAIIDMLLHVAGLLAVGYVLYGGIRYITSQGEPERVSTAKSTIMNALIGLVIVLVAIVAVSFVGRTVG